MSAALHRHYTRIFGSRWPQLFEALITPSSHAARVNSFADVATIANDLRTTEGAAQLDLKSTAFIASTRWPQLSVCPTTKLLTHYNMCPASIAAAELLDVQTDDYVLDMCAAPGGKALVLAEALRNGGKLVANEMNQSRRQRLYRCLSNYLPDDFVRTCIIMSGKDATRRGLQKQAFDRVLLDAPCSSDRHQLQAMAKSNEWTSPPNSKHRVSRQLRLLRSAVQTLRPGGTLVYSTCALNPKENEGVVATALADPHLGVVECSKSMDSFPASNQDGRLAVTFERQQHGWLALPDAQGFGPMYACRLIKPC
eukprot:m.43531 g.43531  ORF g.43531 m.43531 type:complete len:310 (-) comp12933_c0_seq1:84-1013(-)